MLHTYSVKLLFWSVPQGNVARDPYLRLRLSVLSWSEDGSDKWQWGVPVLKALLHSWPLPEK
jgi:hypothetical protein